MADRAQVYDSCDIVEKFLNHKLLNKGLTWEFHLSRHPLRGIRPLSASSSNPGGLRSRGEARAPSSGEEEESDGDTQGIPPHHQQQQQQQRQQDEDEAARVQSRRLRLQSVLQQAAAEVEMMFQRDFLSQMSVHFLHLTPSSVRASLRAVGAELFVDGVNWGRVVALLEFGGAMCVESAKREMSWRIDDIAAWMVESLDTAPLSEWIEENGGWDAFVELYGGPRPPGCCWSMRTVFGLVVLGAAGITLGALFTQK